MIKVGANFVRPLKFSKIIEIKYCYCDKIRVE